MVRVSDVILSLVALIFLSPVLVPVIIILALTGEREIFYSQIRVGKNLRKFNLIKFATMLKDSPNIGSGSLTLHDDPRVLPFGKVLRKTKINELPQLINVIKGEMSLIGPRPITPDTYRLYTEAVQKEISTVRPGLSGLGSIIFRNEDMFMMGEPDPRLFYKDFIAPYKGEIECWFVKNFGFLLYTKAILATIIVVLTPSFLNYQKLFPGLPEMPEALKEKLFQNMSSQISKN